jgi:hypothetical protein
LIEKGAVVEITPLVPKATRRFCLVVDFRKGIYETCHVNGFARIIYPPDKIELLIVPNTRGRDDLVRHAISNGGSKDLHPSMMTETVLKWLYKDHGVRVDMLEEDKVPTTVLKLLFRRAPRSLRDQIGENLSLRDDHD